MSEEILHAAPYLLPLAILGGLAAGSTGFGTYLVLGPAFWLLFLPTEAMAMAISSGLSNYALLFVLRQNIPWGNVAAMLLFALPGLFVGFILHLLLPISILQLTAAVVLLLFRYCQKKKLSPGFAGPLAGVLSTSVGFNGPPVSFVFQGRDQREQRGGTIATLAGLSIIVALIFLLSADGQQFSEGFIGGLLLLPLVALGTWGSLGIAMEKVPR